MRAIVALFILLLCSNILAQQYVDSHNPDEIKSLIGKSSETYGFGGADLKIGDIAGNRSLIIGASGGVIVNRTYFLGLAGYGLVTDNEIDGLIPTATVPMEKKLNIYGGYGGMVFGFTLWTREPVHLHFPFLVGAGAFEVVDNNFFNNNFDTDFSIERSAFFIGEPGVQVEFNITENFRLGTGVSYRLVTGLDMVNLRDEDLTGLSTNISVRFGQF
tara:strand:- start:571 stop:1218 length:648 start_codon:yes stop_codon:yes gene_type:complete